MPSLAYVTRQNNTCSADLAHEKQRERRGKVGYEYSHLFLPRLRLVRFAGETSAILSHETSQAARSEEETAVQASFTRYVTGSGGEGDTKPVSKRVV